MYINLPMMCIPRPVSFESHIHVHNEMSNPIINLPINESSCKLHFCMLFIICETRLY